MQKSWLKTKQVKTCVLSLLIGVGLLGIEPLSANSQFANSSKRQASPNLALELPPCYLQTTDGRVVNLERLCSSGRRSLVAISSVVYNNNFVMGRIVNQSRKAVYGIQINYQIVNEDGTLDRQTASPEPPSLQPQQVGAFEVVIPAGGQVSNLYVTWSEQK